MLCSSGRAKITTTTTKGVVWAMKRTMLGVLVVLIGMFALGVTNAYADHWQNGVYVRDGESRRTQVQTYYPNCGTTYYYSYQYTPPTYYAPSTSYYNPPTTYYYSPPTYYAPPTYCPPTYYYQEPRVVAPLPSYSPPPCYVPPLRFYYNLGQLRRSCR